MTTNRKVNHVFGTILREIRERKQMTQQELANRMGKDAQYISNVETGLRNVHTTSLTNFLNALGVDESILFNMDIYYAAMERKAKKEMEKEQRRYAKQSEQKQEKAKS